MTEGIIVWTLRSPSMLALPEEPSIEDFWKCPRVGGRSVI